MSSSTRSTPRCGTTPSTRRARASIERAAQACSSDPTCAMPFYKRRGCSCSSARMSRLTTVTTGRMGTAPAASPSSRQVITQSRTRIAGRLCAWGRQGRRRRSGRRSARRATSGTSLRALCARPPAATRQHQCLRTTRTRRTRRHLRRRSSALVAAAADHQALAVSPALT